LRDVSIYQNTHVPRVLYGTVRDLFTYHKILIHGESYITQLVRGSMLEYLWNLETATLATPPKRLDPQHLFFCQPAKVLRAFFLEINRSIIPENIVKMGGKRKRAGQEMSAAPNAAKKKQKTAGKSTTQTTKTQTPLDSSPFVDNPKGDELKREVNLYDILSSENEEDRLNAAAAIISGLLEGDGVEESTLQRHLERRLFRGLASGRKAARIGYALVIAEILGQLFGGKDLVSKKYTGLTFDKVLGFLVAKTKPDGDLSGQEEKDHSLGLLFGLQSFVRAKILFEEDERWSNILEKLLKLSEKKPWIREECGWVVAEALGQMNQNQAERTLSILVDAGLALSPEGVGIWLLARSKFPDMTFPSKPWGQSGNPLEHLKALGKALKESSSGDENQRTQQAKQTGNWNPKLHFVWNVVLTHYATAIKNKSDGIKVEFENFWKVAVDGTIAYPLLLHQLILYRKPFLCICLTGTQILGFCPFPKSN
jgi:DNA polymerase phi